MATDNGFNLELYGIPFDYEKMYRDLYSTHLIFDVEETDSEISWKFHDKNINIIAKYMKPQTSGANISPFSQRNLPSKKHEISKDEISIYREIIDDKCLDDKLEVGRVTMRFIMEFIPQKYREYRNQDMKSLMKMKMLKGKEFIHSIGLWNEYLEYLKENL